MSVSYERSKNLMARTPGTNKPSAQQQQLLKAMKEAEQYKIQQQQWEELKKNDPEKFAEMQLSAQVHAYNERFSKLKNKVTSRDVKSSPADLLEYQSMMDQHRAA